MTLLDWYGVKRLAAALVVILLVVVASPVVARAADGAATAVPAPERNGAAGSETGSEKPADQQQETPRLQIQDEGPPAGSEPARQPRIQLPPQNDDAVERPYWKNWVFWSVAGAVVVGTVVTLLYMASGNTDVAPCPVDIAASLDCHGAGR